MHERTFHIQPKLTFITLNVFLEEAIYVCSLNYLYLKFKNIAKNSFKFDQYSWKVSVKEIIFSEVAGHLLASLLRMDSFASISNDFIYTC